MAGARRVLLTGASGLLGGELAGLLVDAGHAVTGIVNRSAAVTRNDGSPIPAEPYGGGTPRAGTIRLLRGDVTAERFGWSDAVAADIAGSHDILLHAAALTRFDGSDADYAHVNVDGTRRVIELAGRGGMDLLHVSTAYVCGERNGAIAEHELDCGQIFANGYEASKAAGERLVRQSGLRHVIVRPSIVVGDHATGRIRRFDTFYVLLKLLAEGRLSTMPAIAGATLDLVPIDHVAAAIVALVECFDRAAGTTLHLVADRPTPVDAFPATLRRHAGLAVPRLVDPAAFDPAALAPEERRLYERGASLYAGYFTRAPRFDGTALRAVSGVRPPPVDMAWWDRLVSYAVTAGYVRPAAPQASRSRPNGIFSEGSTAVAEELR